MTADAPAEEPDEVHAAPAVSFEIAREHHRVSLLDYLDALGEPVDRRLVDAAAREGRIRLNGEPVGRSETLKTGDLLELDVPVASLARRADESLVILHEDDDLLVASKPSGLPFDASRVGSGRSAVERLALLRPGPRPRPVHRLDKDTSGLVIAARSRVAEDTLGHALRSGEARVEYLAIVRRPPRDDEGEVDVPLGKRKRTDAQLVPDERHGRPCRTLWRVEERFRGFGLLRLHASDNGRSHQIRAHLAARGTPAVGDKLYGEDDRVFLSQLKLDYRRKRGRPERPILERPAIHAATLRRGDLVVEAPLPDDLAVFVAQLRRHCAAPGEAADGGSAPAEID